MLRVFVNIEPRGVLVRLDGSLSGKWIDEVRREVASALAHSMHVTLDCSGVLYADSDGVLLLQSFSPEDVTTVNCSGFLRQQLSSAYPTDVEDTR